MIKGPCKDCSSREVGCHAVCEKYGEFKRERDKEKTEIYEAKKSSEVIDKYVLKNRNDYMRRKQKRRRRLNGRVGSRSRARRKS